MIASLLLALAQGPWLFTTGHRFESAEAAGRFVDSGLEIRSRGASTTHWPQLPEVPDRHRIAVSVVLRDGPPGEGFGLAFGGDAAGQRVLAVQLSGTGYVRLLAADGSSPVPWQLSNAVQQGVGARNDLMLEVDGPTVRVSINGTTVVNWTGTVPRHGRLGLITGANQEVRFDRLQVGPLGTSQERLAVPEDFVLTPAHSFTESYGRGRFIDDGLEIRGGPEGAYRYPTLHRAGRYFRFDVSTILREGALNRGHGIVSVWGDSVMYFYVAPNGQYKLMMNRVDAIPWQRHPAIRQGVGQRNDLGLEVAGNLVRLYINGTMVNQWSGQPVIGRLGFTVGSNQEVRFDRVRYTPGTAGETAAAPAPAPAAIPTGPARPAGRRSGFSLQPHMAGADSLMTARIADGVLTIEASSRGAVHVSPISDSVLPGSRIEARFTLLRDNVRRDSSLGRVVVSRPYYGLTFAGPDTLNRRYFFINGFGSYMLAGSGDRELIPDTPSRLLHTDGAPNVLAVELRRDTAVLFINGSEVNRWTGNRSLSGRLGFHLGRSQLLRIDQLRVRAIVPMTRPLLWFDPAATASGDTIRIINDTLIIRPARQLMAVAGLPILPALARIEATAAPAACQADAGGAGIVFGIPEALMVDAAANRQAPFFKLLLDGSGRVTLRSARVNGASDSLLAAGQARVRPGAANHLFVDIRGRNVVFGVNGVAAGRWAGTAEVEGTWGFVAAGCTVSFTSVRVLPPPAARR